MVNTLAEPPKEAWLEAFGVIIATEFATDLGETLYAWLQRYWNVYGREPSSEEFAAQVRLIGDKAGLVESTE